MLFNLSKTVVAIFNSYNDAERAALEIRDNGLRTDDISIVVKEHEDEPPAEISGNKLHMTINEVYTLSPTRGGKISDGIVTGGIIGGVAGILIGATSMFIPGFGAIAAAGPISGLVSGLVTGGVVGSLMSIGVPKEKGRQYEQYISSGHALFSMKVDEDRMNQIIDILYKNGALTVEKY